MSGCCCLVFFFISSQRHDAIEFYISIVIVQLFKLTDIESIIDTLLITVNTVFHHT